MPTKPGFVWNGTEWIPLWSEATVNPFKYQASAPTSPATGDIWIDSDYDVPSVDVSQFLRWSKTVTGGQTSLSGADDNALVLQYTPNYEQIYINGVLQVRGQDYIGTTGTSITGLTALSAGDVVEVFSVVARTVADVYTQAQSDSKYSPVTTTGSVLLNTTTFTAASAVNFNNVFSSAYDNYQVVVSVNSGSTSTNFLGQIRGNGSNLTTSTYRYGLYYIGSYASVSPGSANAITNSVLDFGVHDATVGYSAVINVYKPFLTQYTQVTCINAGNNMITMGGTVMNTTSYDGISFYPSSGTITGTIRIYGYK